MANNGYNNSTKGKRKMKEKKKKLKKPGIIKFGNDK